jgi:hypothetical protein
MVKLKRVDSDAHCSMCRKKNKISGVAVMEYNDEDMNHCPITFGLCDRCLMYIRNIINIYYEEKNYDIL